MTNCFSSFFISFKGNNCRKPDNPEPTAWLDIPQRKQNMNLEQLTPGDLVYAACHIYNDGSIPGITEVALLAAPGTPT